MLDQATAPCVAPDLASYDKFVVAFSGGKDSIALVLHLIDLGIPRDKIELHHHDIDGHGPTFMDWEITPAYCRAFAKAMGLPIYFSWREGGFQREMDRDGVPTAPIVFDRADGTQGRVGGNGPAGTRGLFPQVSANLSVRWCSAALKVDVLDRLICNEPRFLNCKTLVLTGERAQESAARAKYKVFEPHRTDTRDGTRKPRHVDVWRAVHGWNEIQVWAIMRRYGIVPHPAYRLGWNRLSCMTCIFGSANQWATIQAVFLDRFTAIAARELQSGKTIQRVASVSRLAARGTPYAAALANPDLVALARSTEWQGPILIDPSAWVLPAGAFGENAGPC